MLKLVEINGISFEVLQKDDLPGGAGLDYVE